MVRLLILTDNFSNTNWVENFPHNLARTCFGLINRIKRGFQSGQPDFYIPSLICKHRHKTLSIDLRRLNINFGNLEHENSFRV